MFHHQSLVYYSTLISKLLTLSLFPFNSQHIRIFSFKSKSFYESLSFYCFKQRGSFCIMNNYSQSTHNEQFAQNKTRQYPFINPLKTSYLNLCIYFKYSILCMGWFSTIVAILL